MLQAIQVDGEPTGIVSGRGAGSIRDDSIERYRPATASFGQGIAVTPSNDPGGRDVPMAVSSSSPDSQRDS